LGRSVARMIWRATLFCGERPSSTSGT
jgi:hypothetical protein